MIRTGLDVLLRNTGRIKGKKIALIVNHTSVGCTLSHSWNLLKEKNIHIERIFSPEHGLFGTEQDQVPVGTQADPGIPVISLYGESEVSLVPSAGMFSGLDAVIFDIQDVGSRYYTYLNTMIYFMKALHGSGIAFIVLDRPNPLTGVEVEGPLLENGYESFVGVLPVPVRHGLTAGETAMFARDYFRIDVDLEVIAMEGWTRNMYYDTTGLAWVPPSPNMPSPETALVYPGMCLLEGTNLSEGRGSTTPFELSGAPWIDAFELARALNNENRPGGVIYRPHYFIPVVSKHAGRVCGGVFIHVTDRRVFRPFYQALYLLWHVRRLYGEFVFSSGVYEYRCDIPAFDLLCGSGEIRSMMENGASPDEIAGTWRTAEREFAEFKRAYHIYPEEA